MIAAPDSPRKIRLLLVEDHVLVRLGLVAAADAEPDLRVVAEVEDGRLAVAAVREHRPDVVLLDLRLPGVDGVDVLRALRHDFPGIRVLMLSSYGGGDDIARALREGAAGYVIKGTALEELLHAIRVVNGGGTFFPPGVARRVEACLHSELSARELEVLKLIAQGRSNKEIAAQLGIVEGTVKAHVAHILTKLGALDRAQAMAIAVKRQILQLE